MRTSIAAFLALSVATVAMAQDEPKRNIAGYELNLGANAVFVGIYAVIAAGLFWRSFQTRTKYLLVEPIGAVCVAIGFVGRLLYSKQTDSLGLYIFQQLFIVVTPACFFAGNYILYGRLAMAAGPEYSKIKPEKTAKFFVWSDVITFFVQAAGGGMMATENLANAGRVIIMIGIAAQFGSYLVFLFLVTTAHRAMSRDGILEKRSTGTNPTKKLYLVLYFSSIWIIVRSIFRLVEFAQGHDGKIATTEGYLLGLDAVPLALASGIYVLYWPVYLIRETRDINKGLPVMSSPASDLPLRQLK